MIPAVLQILVCRCLQLVQADQVIPADLVILKAQQDPVVLAAQPAQLILADLAGRWFQEFQEILCHLVVLRGLGDLVAQLVQVNLHHL